MFRQSGGKEMIRVSLLLVVFLVALGCTHAIPMMGTMEAPPTTARVPLRLGVYYSQDFRNYRYLGSRGGDRWDFPLGSSSTRLFDRVFADMFISAQKWGQPPALKRQPRQTRCCPGTENRVLRFCLAVSQNRGLHRRDHLPLYPLHAERRAAGLLDGPGFWQQAREAWL